MAFSPISLTHLNSVALLENNAVDRELHNQIAVLLPVKGLNMAIWLVGILAD